MNKNHLKRNLLTNIENITKDNVKMLSFFDVKKLFSIALFAIIILSIVGCSNKNKGDLPSLPTTESTASVDNNSEEPEESVQAESTDEASQSANPESTILPSEDVDLTLEPSNSSSATATSGTVATNKSATTSKPTATSKSKTNNTSSSNKSTTPKANTTSPTTKSSSSGVTYKKASLQKNVQNGVILHAFNCSYTNIKNNLASIANAGYTAIQTSPVQQPKDYSSSYKDVNGQWWKLYQPVSFSIAKSSWLGTESQLKVLCAEADKYGIKIIVDIVVNHLGASSSSSTTLNEAVKTYEPTIYNSYSTYFHPYVSCNDNSIRNVVQGNIGMPDLNTGNSYVQGRVISLLKQCIDAGVDGFRFDAAKHIETSSDGSYKSNFWSNVISSAKSYASSKGTSIYVYGEILNTPGNGRNYSSYTSFMSITDNRTADNILVNVNNGNASGAASPYYHSGQSASKIVLWAESHDTYMGNSGSMGLGSTKGISSSKVDKAYAIAASRADATALYFIRPGSASMGQIGTSYYKGTAISKVNLFHNYFVGKSEYLSSSNNVVMNERYATSRGSNCGAVLVNVSGTSKTISNMPTYRMGNGTYYDQITGNKFTVSNGKISGTIGGTGIAVIM